jgi:hypothetical protein
MQGAVAILGLRVAGVLVPLSQRTSALRAVTPIEWTKHSARFIR